MISLISNLTGKRKGLSSQTLPLVAGSIATLLAFTGLAIDAGMVFATKAKLNKAVDAAALTATKNISKPESEVRQYVYNAVQANFPGAEMDVDTDITFDYVSKTPAVLVDVKATYLHKTSFIRILPVPSFKEFEVEASAQAIRFPIIMGIVVDRSGSMDGNSGSGTIQSTMPSFLDNFSESMDQVGIYSFSAVAYRELRYTNSFKVPGMARFASTGIHYGGYTGPTDAWRMCLDDMEEVTGYNQMGVKKIIVFLTDGVFNSFKTRPANTMGAFNDPPSGMSQSTWSNLWFTSFPSTTNYGTDTGGQSYGSTNITVGLTNATSYTRFTNLDCVLTSYGSKIMWFPAMGNTNTYRFTSPVSMTNVYGTNTAAYTTSNSALNMGSNTILQRVNSNFRCQVTGNTLWNAINFVSSADGNVKTLTNANVNAVANDHVKRYSKAARKTTTSADKVTVFVIGYTSAVEEDVLKEVANVSGSAPPYAAIDASSPSDNIFGYTFAGDSDALERTLTALGVYLATRLTK